MKEPLIIKEIYKMLDRKCKCGFKFASAGEFRNCNAFIDAKGQSGIICPACGKNYLCRKGGIIYGKSIPEHMKSLLNKQNHKKNIELDKKLKKGKGAE